MSFDDICPTTLAKATNIRVGEEEESAGGGRAATRDPSTEASLSIMSSQQTSSLSVSLFELPPWHRILLVLLLLLPGSCNMFLQNTVFTSMMAGPLFASQSLSLVAVCRSGSTTSIPNESLSVGTAKPAATPNRFVRTTVLGLSSSSASASTSNPLSSPVADGSSCSLSPRLSSAITSVPLSPQMNVGNNDTESVVEPIFSESLSRAKASRTSPKG
mmetsp:Transcript_23078/g.63981  ORF Transcript_23078/g.63981 Transcript_23078/m.63981 type:complete len:216 (+) Transcript_23078:152-799(+)